ncbi:uncharacterized protein [Littorina saxatilis]|uniref:uncharacterized protein n=1 Tax=Littorina saxatilis TaxID=31220 RepID=UPI0038B48AE4
MLKLTLLCLLFVPTLWADDSEILLEGYVRIDLEPGFHGNDGCLATIDCATDKLPRDSDIVSVRLYHETARNQTRIHVLLAKADQHTNLWLFQDRVQMANAGAFFTRDPVPVCPGLKYCRDTTTYFIYPIQEENLGKYMCETRVRKGNQTLLYVGWATLAFDRCCIACPYCSMQVGGVRDRFSQWSPAQCNGGCVQQRQPERCLTRHCKWPEPVQKRRCFQDGVCDETELVKIHTERVKDRCRAKIQCTIDNLIYNVTSVQLFHVWGPRGAVQFTGRTNVDYRGRILLAEATAGVNGGRYDIRHTRLSPSLLDFLTLSQEKTLMSRRHSPQNF